MNAVNVSDVVRFKYNGGSTPGDTRTVFVTGVLDGIIEGLDKKVNAYRKFSVSKISGFEKLKTTVHPGLSMNKLAQVHALYADNPDYVGAFFDNTNKQVVVAFDDKTANISVQCNWNGNTSVVFTAKNGKTFKIATPARDINYNAVKVTYGIIYDTTTKVYDVPRLLADFLEKNQS
jgi:hypothetical protein